MLDWCINKINEVALDLREPQHGANIEHQAQKLDKVAAELSAMRDLLLNSPISPKVHGGGTGEN